MNPLALTRDSSTKPSRFAWNSAVGNDTDLFDGSIGFRYWRAFRRGILGFDSIDRWRTSLVGGAIDRTGLTIDRHRNLRNAIYSIFRRILTDRSFCSLNLGGPGSCNRSEFILIQREMLSARSRRLVIQGDSRLIESLCLRRTQPRKLSYYYRFFKRGEGSDRILFRWNAFFLSVNHSSAKLQTFCHTLFFTRKTTQR